MKKSSFVAMILGTISGVLFALGMCMALIPEWDAFQPGIICGCVGLILALITLAVWRRMEHKTPILPFRQDNRYDYRGYIRGLDVGDRHVL